MRKLLLTAAIVVMPTALFAQSVSSGASPGGLAATPSAAPITGSEAASPPASAPDGSAASVPAAESAPSAETANVTGTKHHKGHKKATGASTDAAGSATAPQ